MQVGYAHPEYDGSYGGETWTEYGEEVECAEVMSCGGDTGE